MTQAETDRYFENIRATSSHLYRDNMDDKDVIKAERMKMRLSARDKRCKI